MCPTSRGAQRALIVPGEAVTSLFALHVAPSRCWASCWLLLKTQPFPLGNRRAELPGGPRPMDTNHPHPEGLGPSPTHPPKCRLPGALLRQVGLEAFRFPVALKQASTRWWKAARNVLLRPRPGWLPRTAFSLRPPPPICIHFLPPLCRGPAVFLGRVPENTSSFPGPAPSSSTLFVTLTTGVMLVMPGVC